LPFFEKRQHVMYPSGPACRNQTFLAQTRPFAKKQIGVEPLFLSAILGRARMDIEIIIGCQLHPNELAEFRPRNAIRP
jgi:hypothetical protein